MAEQQGQAASFNPADASGLFDGGRALIKTVEVNTFKSGKGDSFVNVDVTYLTEGRDMTEHLMLGGVDKWAPLPDKSGAISLDNKKVWNKSDPYRWVTSLVNAGFPSNKVGQNLKVFEGLDVTLQRVTTEGKYTDKNGKERENSVVLVTAIHTSKEDIASGAYAKNAGAAAGKAAAPAATKKATAAAAPAAPTPAVEVSDEYVQNLLVEILSGGAVETKALGQKAFVLITKDKSVKAEHKADTRKAVTARLADDAFIASLVEQGLVARNGNSLEIAA